MQGTSRATVSSSSKPGVSAWDKIVSDVKKKKPTNDSYNSKYKKNDTDEEMDDYYDEESEYDSEMDDFIADDDEIEEEIKNDEQNKKYTKEYSKCIREMFKYNPNKYKDQDDDIDDMETDFQTLMKEERNS